MTREAIEELLDEACAELSDAELRRVLLAAMLLQAEHCPAPGHDCGPTPCDRVGAY